MQKRLSLILLTILSSCTVVRKAPVKHYSLELFQPIKSEQRFYQNEFLEITFISCRKRWLSEGGQAKKFLKTKFQKTYGVELAGLSNLKVELTHIVDSSLPSEVCQKVVGNPVTRELLDINDKEQWRLVNPAHHIH